MKHPERKISQCILPLRQRFPVLRQKPNEILRQKLAKGATIHFLSI